MAIFVALVLVTGGLVALYAHQMPANEPILERIGEVDGYMWTKASFTAPGISFEYKEPTDGSYKIGYYKVGNEIVSTFTSTAAEYTSTTTAFTLYTKQKAESPQDALHRLIISNYEDPYFKEHCVVEKIEDVILTDDLLENKPFSDASKSAWNIFPDDVFQQRIVEETLPGYTPELYCPEGRQLFAFGYYEFHEDSQTFIYTSMQDIPHFDQDSLDF